VEPRRAHIDDMRALRLYAFRLRGRMRSVKSYALEELTTAKLTDIAVIRREAKQPAVWEKLARREIGERERAALEFILDKLRDYGTLRVNEATIWARAIYPLLALAERDDIRAWSLVPLSGRFNDVEIGGEVDGALASSFAEEVELPYFIVVEAKRGVGGTDPMASSSARCCARRSATSTRVIQRSRSTAASPSATSGPSSAAGSTGANPSRR
jgi:uncharacterized protein YjiS (DUF1127 family)